MSQVRLFVAAGEADARRLFEALEPILEDEGLPLSLQEIDDKARRWEVSVYAGAAAQDEIRARIVSLVADVVPRLAVEHEEVPDIDWVAHSLNGLAPVRVGRFLVHGAHDRGEVRPGDVAIEIEAGQAFGTGHHGTTAGCLEMIEWTVRRNPPRKALDLGTGSGVLAIALARISHARLLATDIDPVATETAAANARLNGVAKAIHFETAAGLRSAVFRAHGPFDLIVANILARPLMDMAPELERHLAGDGSLIVSGILAEQRRKVIAAFVNHGLYAKRTLWRGDWVTMLMRRK